MITIKVIRVPGAVVDVALEDGATVENALSAAGTSLQSGEKVTVNGSDASLGTVLSDGDKVILAKGAKGNS
jgi:uncharacterized Zn ribbon protein